MLSLPALLTGTFTSKSSKIPKKIGLFQSSAQILQAFTQTWLARIANWTERHRATIIHMAKLYDTCLDKLAFIVRAFTHTLISNLPFSMGFIHGLIAMDPTLSWYLNAFVFAEALCLSFCIHMILQDVIDTQLLIDGSMLLIHTIMLITSGIIAVNTALHPMLFLITLASYCLYLPLNSITAPYCNALTQQLLSLPGISLMTSLLTKHFVSMRAWLAQHCFDLHDKLQQYWLDRTATLQWEHLCQHLSDKTFNTLLSPSEFADLDRCLQDPKLHDHIKNAINHGSAGIVLSAKSSPKSQLGRLFSNFTHHTMQTPRKIVLHFFDSNTMYFSPEDRLAHLSLSLHVLPKSKAPGGSKLTDSLYKTQCGGFKICEYAQSIHWQQPDKVTESVFLTQKHNAKSTLSCSAGHALNRIAKRALERVSGLTTQQQSIKQPSSWILFPHPLPAQGSGIQTPSATASHAPGTPPVKPKPISAVENLLQPELILEMMTQISAQLSTLHLQFNTAHHDVKLENICVDANNQFRLIDYPDHIETSNNHQPIQANRPGSIAYTPLYCGMQNDHLLISHSADDPSWAIPSTVSGLPQPSALKSLLTAQQYQALNQAITCFKRHTQKTLRHHHNAYHDTWSLLCVALRLAAYLPDPHAMIFSQAITDYMTKMLQTYVQLIDQPDGEAKLSARFATQTTIAKLLHNIGPLSSAIPVSSISACH